MTDNIYAIWKDWRTGAYEIVRWTEGVPLIVQVNIMTREKAEKAREIWQRRETEKACTRSK